MDIITITKENIEKEHICCCISNDNDCQVSSKKEWMKKELDNGLVFKKGNVRGKCFIEYIPAENAWAPVEANGYMYINCLWISGQFKGHGYSNLLVDECISDSKAKGKKGLVILSSEKKKGFIADKKYLLHKGFIVCDSAKPFYELMYLPFDKNAGKPSFKAKVKIPHTDKNGFVLYYANQCPFTAKYVPLIEKLAKDRNVNFEAIKFTTAKEAQNSPAPFTSYSLFYNGEFVTHEILSENKFIKLIEEKGL